MKPVVRFSCVPRLRSDWDGGIVVSENGFCASMKCLTSRACPSLALRAGISYRTPARSANEGMPARSASKGRRRKEYANASPTPIACGACVCQPEALARDEGRVNMSHRTCVDGR